MNVMLNLFQYPWFLSNDIQKQVHYDSFYYTKYIEFILDRSGHFEKVNLSL